MEMYSVPRNAVLYNVSCHFTFLISLLLRPKTETKRLNLCLSPELRSTNHRSSLSLMSLATHRWFRCISLFIFELAKSEVIFAHQNLISNRLIYLVHAKSTGELISFGFSDRSNMNLRWVQTKNDFTFWLIFGLSLNLGLSESLIETLIQKVKWPVDVSILELQDQS